MELSLSNVEKSEQAEQDIDDDAHRNGDPVLLGRLEFPGPHRFDLLSCSALQQAISVACARHGLNGWPSSGIGLHFAAPADTLEDIMESDMEENPQVLSGMADFGCGLPVCQVQFTEEVAYALGNAPEILRCDGVVVAAATGRNVAGSRATKQPS